jgi:LacI family purine nucleotide synthesis repressor
MQLAKRPSIREVAALAGVSPAVVSAVLNGTTSTVRFSPDAASRVRKVAEELGYIPNKLTRSIIRKSPLAIGVLTPWPDHEKYGKIIKILAQEFRNRGYHMIVEVCDFDPDNFLRHFRDIVSMQVGGMIILPFATSQFDKEAVFKLATRCRRMSPATVVVDWYWQEMILDSVNVDMKQLISLPLRHLLDNGHRDIVCIGCGSPRRASYITEVLAEYGLESRGEYCTSGLAQIYKQDYEEGRLLAEAALKLSPRPTALMCLQDRMAIGAYKVCELAGLKVGRDIAITGGDNMIMSQHMTVPLTTVDIHTEKFAQALVDILMAKMSRENPDIPHVLEIVPHLVVRESSDFKL